MREYQAYKAAWAEAAGGPSPSAREMNRRLHSERIVRGTHRRRLHGVPWRELPEGAFVVYEDTPCLVLEGELVAWGLNGYGKRRRRPAGGTAVAITPPATLAVLRVGYPVQIDSTALAGAPADSRGQGGELEKIGRSSGRRTERIEGDRRWQ